MASVTARAPVAALRPSSASLKSSSAFLGHSSRLGRTASPTRRSLKAEAKGEWLPGLPSPSYLDGRSVLLLLTLVWPHWIARPQRWLADD
jgi:light-harvesting complex I chlorophyll a/b binding protein 4